MLDSHTNSILVTNKHDSCSSILANASSDAPKAITRSRTIDILWLFIYLQVTSATSYHLTCTVGVCVVLLLCADDDCHDLQAARTTTKHINSNRFFRKKNTQQPMLPNTSTTAITKLRNTSTITITTKSPKQSQDNPVPFSIVFSSYDRSSVGRSNSISLSFLIYLKTILIYNLNFRPLLLWLSIIYLLTWWNHKYNQSRNH